VQSRPGHFWSDARAGAASGKTRVELPAAVDEWLNTSLFNIQAAKI
jgi:hypothetical protein